MELPPELVADHGDIESRRRFNRILHRKQDSGGTEKQDDDDEDRDDGPGELDFYAAEHLRGLCRVSRAGAKTNQCIHQQRAYAEEYSG